MNGIIMMLSIESIQHYKRIDNLIKMKRNCQKKSDQWREMIDLVNLLLELPYLTGSVSEEIRDTHLFGFHPIYGQAWNIIEELNRVMSRTSELASFQKELATSPYIYEKWVYFKIINYLITKLGFIPNQENIGESLIRYYKQHNNSMKGFSVRLSLGKTSIEIFSEKQYSDKETGKNLFPDISLLITTQNPKNKMMAFLDAKYKPYSKMKTLFDKDLKHSAKRYRERADCGCDKVIAFLAHPDENYRTYNYTSPHKEGAILLRPDNDEDLSIWFKIIFHYECSKCKTFWVKNSCWNKLNRWNVNGVVHENENLYKYIIGNFHESNRGDWDMECPICKKYFSDRFNRK